MIREEGKMTHTINRNVYTQLLAKVVPKIIDTETEYQETLKEIEKLLFIKNRSVEENALYDLLVMLVEKYETENHPLDEANPNEILQHLLDARDINESDLVNILGSQKIVSEMIKGDRLINLEQANILGKYFQVSPDLFLP